MCQILESIATVKVESKSDCELCEAAEYDIKRFHIEGEDLDIEERASNQLGVSEDVCKTVIFSHLELLCGFPMPVQVGDAEML